MLKGKEFGAAIAKAIELKLESGKVRYRADIARHFGVKPPSMADWVKKGSFSKEKLPELFRYFSDVVGYEHWGMTEDEWPSGLVPQNIIEGSSIRIDDLSKPSATTPAFTMQVEDWESFADDEAKELPKPITIIPKSQRDKDIEEIILIARQLSDTGIGMLLGYSQKLLEERPAKQTESSSR